MTSVPRLLLLFSIGFVVAAAPTFAAAQNRSRPNVLLIMTDDQGYGDLACHGNPTLKTPNLDRLHAESVRFTDFHVSPLCTPTRSALMTGRYPARTGAYRTSSGRTSLHAREKTLGALFAENGYATGIFGKWHLGDCAPSRPMDKGFDTAVWHRCGGVTQISDYWTNDYFDDTYLVGTEWTAFNGYCTDVWFDEAMKFIETNRERPFFVYLPTNAPHGPYLVADRWKAPYLAAGSQPSQAAFQGMVANFDWNLGRMLAFLKEQALVENTLLVFLTDNGTARGTVFDERGFYEGWPVDPRENADMRGGKSSPYEGGHRVPLFVRWPAGGFGEPRDIDALSAHVDLTPTLMELCDLKRPDAWPPLDGRSLAPLLRGESTAWPDRTLFLQIHGGNGYAAPDDPWISSAVLTDQWRLVQGTELYDITTDPAQRTDLATEHPDVVARLRAAHEQWMDSVRPGMEPTRIALGSAAENPVDLTSQEWVMPVGGPPWAHQHVVRRMIANAPWPVDVARPGTYRITLSRWPRYIHEPIDSTAARITIAGHDRSATIEHPDLDTEITFELELPVGPTELQTWLTTPDGQTHGAYFVTVECVGGDSAGEGS